MLVYEHQRETSSTRSFPSTSLLYPFLEWISPRTNDTWIYENSRSFCFFLCPRVEVRNHKTSVDFSWQWWNLWSSHPFLHRQQPLLRLLVVRIVPPAIFYSIVTFIHPLLCWNSLPREIEGMTSAYVELLQHRFQNHDWSRGHRPRRKNTLPER